MSQDALDLLLSAVKDPGQRKQITRCFLIFLLHRGRGYNRATSSGQLCGGLRQSWRLQPLSEVQSSI
jgi:hypothetical protein